jgi:hypothetical protein
MSAAAPVELCRAAPWHFDELAACHRVLITGKWRYPNETVLQAGIRREIELTFPCMVSAVPNGTNIATKSGRGKARHEGLRAGYPDLIIDGMGLNAGRVYRAEIKAGAGVSREQYAVLSELYEGGHRCGVFRSAETLKAELLGLGWLKR